MEISEENLHIDIGAWRVKELTSFQGAFLFYLLVLLL